ncbi:DM10 domain containing protein [Lotmaria passim]
MSTDSQLRLSMANESNVPKEYMRAVDAHLLPPRVGHNWNDQAFRAQQGKPQQLEAEFRGTRAFTAAANGSTLAAAPPDMCLTAEQLVDALAAASRNRNAASRTAHDAAAMHAVTLADKVLRFYAFFSEHAPEGGATDYWHRKVVISFFVEDDTLMIVEPRTFNSGLDGGTFLKRQKVVADPRQREQHPNEEYVSLNYLNVGQSVRLNAVDFFIYDCDAFTRDFLTALGVEVGPAEPCPDDYFMSEYSRYQERQKSGKFGLLSQDFSAEEEARTARFVRDGGKMLRFFAVLDERETLPGGGVRRLEVVMFVEDYSIAILQRQSTAGNAPGLYLSRGWLPKSGSAAKVNELTFMHRVNGQREPDMGGPDAYYRDTDLDVGVTLNVYGRSVLLYDCDDYTREFYATRYGVTLKPAIDVSAFFQDGQRTVMSTMVSQNAKKAETRGGNASGEGGVAAHGGAKDTLRFRAVLANPSSHDDELRRFAVTFYTDTEEFVVYESALPTVGIHGGCMWKRRRAAKAPPKTGPRNAPKPPMAADTLPYYTLADLTLNSEVLINGLRLRLTEMDAHTAAFFEGSNGNSTAAAGKAVASCGPAMATDATGAVVTVEHLVSELRGYLRSRFGSGVASFLALDRDRDGLVSVPEFTAAMKDFQITEDKNASAAIFAHIAPSSNTAYFTSEDLMRWIDSVTEADKKRSSRRSRLPSGNEEAELKAIEQRALRTKALRELKSRLDARCWKGADMFRLASTMPRAYRGRRADLYSLTNPDRDTRITPVQLRRCMEEILGASPTSAEMAYLLGFFFPSLPEEAYTQMRDEDTSYSVDLNEFQHRYYEMTKETMLPETTPKENN